MIAPLYVRKDGTPVYYLDSASCDSCGAGVPASQCCAPIRGSDCEFCGGYPARFGCTHNP